MSRLIDADALKERFEREERSCIEHGRNFSFSFENGGEYCAEWWAVQQMVDDAPTVDAVQVVRCKECRWYDNVDWCVKLRLCGVKAVEETWYCADGERKSDVSD